MDVALKSWIFLRKKKKEVLLFIRSSPFWNQHPSHIIQNFVCISLFEIFPSHYPPLILGNKVSHNKNWEIMIAKQALFQKWLAFEVYAQVYQICQTEYVFEGVASYFIGSKFSVIFITYLLNVYYCIYHCYFP